MITAQFSVEFADGTPQKAIVSVRCPICGKETRIEMTHDQYDEYEFAANNPKEGKKIQDIFPDMPVEKREQLCSGYCDEHRAQVFAAPAEAVEAVEAEEGNDEAPAEEPVDVEEAPNEKEEWAEVELKRLEEGCEGNEDGLGMQKMVTECVLELLRVFRRQGHSGFSASYVCGCFDRLVAFKPLSALTGEEDEWGDKVSHPDGTFFQQNKRCSSVFRDNGDNATAIDVDAVSFSDNGGVTFFSNGKLRKKYGDTVRFPYYPPISPRKVYIRWLNDECTEYEDITKDEEAKKNLRDRFYADMEAAEAEEKAKKLQEAPDKAEKPE